MAEQQQTVDDHGLDDGFDAFLNGPNYSKEPVQSTPAGEEEKAEETVETQEAESSPQEDEQEQQGTDAASEDDATDSEAETAATEVSDAEVERLIEQFAKETGLDPKDSGQRKTLNRLAQKEVHILRQQNRIRELEGDTAQPDKGATSAEEEIFSQYKDEKPQPKEEPSRSQDGDKPLWETWTSVADPYKAVAKAWEKVQKENDFSDVNKVDQALFSARLLSSTPYIQQIAERVIQNTFGELMPDIEATVRSKRSDSAREWAINALSNEKGYEDIDGLFKEDGDGALVIDGQKYPNSPLNRILKDNPEIMDIHVTEHNGKFLSEADSLRLTFMKRFRAVSKLHKMGKIDSKQARDLVDAGARMGKRAETEKVRQGMNRGSGAGQKQKDKTYGQYLAEASRGGAQSLSDL